jgi:ppGpp synthetase/RelA/SpoT-type nucleotidyltranferase
MRENRTVEDRLREEYFDLLPDIRRVTESLETRVRYCVLPLLLDLNGYEQVAVKSRVKDCESALSSLRRRQEGRTFDRDHPALYSLTGLNDLAGVRVLAFPGIRVTEANQKVRGLFTSWEADPVRDDTGRVLAHKYHGFCDASTKVRGEVQIVSTLVGLFWEVEHSALYKASPLLRDVGEHQMKDRVKAVLRELGAFEVEFQAHLPDRNRGGSLF